MLDANLRVGGLVALRERIEHAVVVDDAVLEDLDERRALEAVSGHEHATEARLVHVDRPRDEFRPRAERKRSG